MGRGNIPLPKKVHNTNIMSKDRDFKDQRVVAADYKMPRGTVVRQNALTVKKVLTAEFDTAGTDSAGVSNKTIATHGSGVYLPDNAIITKVWYDVITTFTSATDAGTIAIHAAGANDLLNAIAIDDASAVFDAGMHHGIPGSYALGADADHDTALEVGALKAGSFIKLTAEKEIIFTVAVEALVLGKLVIYVEYMISD